MLKSLIIFSLLPFTLATAPLSAYALTQKNNAAESAQPSKIVALPDDLYFISQGDTTPMEVTLLAPDGQRTNITDSPDTVYLSADPATATIDSHGLVTAIKGGSTSIFVTYKEGAEKYNTKIPVLIESEGIIMEPSSITFPEQRIGTTSDPVLIHVINNTNAPVTIEDIGTTANFGQSNNCEIGAPLEAHASCAVNINFTPFAGGERQGRFFVKNSLHGMSSIILSSAAPPAPQAAEPSQGYQ